jgi:hypothetical protein
MFCHLPELPARLTSGQKVKTSTRGEEIESYLPHSAGQFTADREPLIDKGVIHASYLKLIGASRRMTQSGEGIVVKRAFFRSSSQWLNLGLSLSFGLSLSETGKQTRQHYSKSWLTHLLLL